MFENKLEEAARKSRQQLIVLLLFVLVLVLGGGIAFLLTQISFNNTSSDFVPQKAEAVEKTPEVLPLTESVTEPAPEEKKQAPELRTEAAPEMKVPGTPVQMKSNDDVVKALNRYEKELEPFIASQPFGGWNKSLQTGLAARKDRIITELANGATDAAFEGVNELIADASAAKEKFDADFAAAMTEAKASFDADDATTAKYQIEEALSLKPADPTALTLADRIEKLPGLLDLMEKARVAGIENDLAGELALSRKIYELDSAREAYRARADEIEVTLREQRFNEAVTRGIAAERREDLTGLNKAYEAAKVIYPNREETRNLATSVTELKKKLAFRQFIKEGDAAVNADDWSRVLDSYQKAAAIDPDNVEVQSTISMAQNIQTSKNEIAGFLNDPKRLSSATVRRAADTATVKADIYGAMSPSLAGAVDQLKTEIVRWNTEIDVWVLSDKLTDVSVRSVGKVGKVARYKVRLKPGDYIFEGRREGFRTKSVRITIAPDDRNIEVTVISDERI